jgi:hypothetical protein
MEDTRMDANGFDRLATFVGRGRSRRGVLRGLLGSALVAWGLVGWAPGEEAAAREGVLDGRLGGRHGPNRRGRDRHRAHGDKKGDNDQRDDNTRGNTRKPDGTPCTKPAQCRSGLCCKAGTAKQGTCCPNGLTCLVNGTCARPCTVDADCADCTPAGSRCSRESTEGQKLCTPGQACASLETCVPTNPTGCSQGFACIPTCPQERVCGAVAVCPPT